MKTKLRFVFKTQKIFIQISYYTTMVVYSNSLQSIKTAQCKLHIIAIKIFQISVLMQSLKDHFHSHSAYLTKTVGKNMPA